MENNNSFRDLFIAYFYCLIKNPNRHKYLIQEPKLFNKREYPLYKVLKDIIEEDSEPIEIPIIKHYCKISQLDSDFNFVYYSGDKAKYDFSRIDSYYNTLYKEYQINLFRDAKTDKDIANAISVSEQINELTDSNFINSKEALEQLLTDDGIDALMTSLRIFDEKIFLSNGILLVAGSKGSGKTSLVVDLIKKIMVSNHPIFPDNPNKKKISVQWNTMEDRIKMIIAKMISKEIGVPAKNLIRKNSKFKEKAQQGLYDAIFKIIKDFNIEYQDKQLSMAEIKVNWKAFLKKEKKAGCEFPILIIDNIMQLTDNNTRQNQTADDDYIWQQISVCRNEAKKIYGDEYLIIVVHHLSKAMLEKSNAVNCYKPNQSSIRGSGRSTDLITTGILLHRYYNHMDLVNDFKEYSKYMKYIVNIQCIKNREGGWQKEANVWFDLDYNYLDNYLIDESNDNDEQEN